MFIIGLGVMVVMALTTRGQWPLMGQSAVNTVLLAALWGLSQTRHYRVAAAMLCLAPVLGSLRMGMLLPEADYWAAYPALSILLAGFFFDARKAAAFWLVIVAAVGALLLRNLELIGVEQAFADWMFILWFGVLMLITQTQTAGLERERPADLAERERVQTHLLRASFDGIAQHDGGRLRDVGGPFARALGSTPEALEGAMLVESFTMEDRPRIEAALHGGTAEPIEVTAASADGSEHPLELIALRVSTGEGAVEQVAVRNVGERQRLEQERRQVERMQAVGLLAGGVAHDFNNMLAVVLAEGEFVLAEAQGEQREAMESLLRSARRGSVLTRQLLAFSGRSSGTPEVVSIPAMMAGMQTILRQFLAGNITLRLETDEPARIRVDREQLENVIINLAANAADAMSVGGGELVVRTWTPPEPGTVALSFIDTGRGMTDETIRQAFDPFYATRNARAGVGLGLTIVRSFAESHGGRVSIESSAAGTTITLLLTALDEVEEPTEPTAPPPPDRGLRVLLVEDQEGVRRAVTRMLELMGFGVISAGGREEACRIVDDRDEQFDLVLSDVILGDGTGPETVDYLLQHRPNTPVIFMSGYADSLLDASNVPADAERLAKPFSRADLAQAIERTMQRPS